MNYSPPTIVFVNQKGGTGKSSLLLSVAVCAFLAGLRVVILDLDPQGAAVRWDNDAVLDSRS